MPLRPELHRCADYLVVRVVGPASVEDGVAMLQLLRHTTIEYGDTRLLLDLRGVEDAFTDREEREIARHCALSLSHLQRVASLVRGERRTGTGERAAAGFPLRVFTREDDAIAWLTQ